MYGAQNKRRGVTNSWSEKGTPRHTKNQTEEVVGTCASPRLPTENTIGRETAMGEG